MTHISDDKPDEFEPLPIYRRPKQDTESDDTAKGNETKPVESIESERDSVRFQFHFVRKLV